MPCCHLLASDVLKEHQAVRYTDDLYQWKRPRACGRHTALCESKRQWARSRSDFGHTQSVIDRNTINCGSKRLGRGKHCQRICQTSSQFKGFHLSRHTRHTRHLGNTWNRSLPVVFLHHLCHCLCHHQQMQFHVHHQHRLPNNIESIAETRITGSSYNASWMTI